MTKHRHFTVPNFLVAMIVAIAAMPTNVFKVDHHGLGIEHLQPWRTRSNDGGLRRLGRTLMCRLTALCAGWRGHPLAMPAAATAAMLVVALAVPNYGQDVTMAAPVVMAGGSVLKQLRQQAADLDGKIAANQQSTLEIETEVSQLRDKVAAEKRAMTADERAKLTTLTDRKKTNRELLASLLEDKRTVAVDLSIAEEDNEADRRQPDPAPGGDAEASRRAASTVVAGAHHADTDPKRGFRDHREFMTKVMEAARFNKVDARLKPLQIEAAAGSDEQGTYSDPHGGFAVPVAFSPDILSVQAEADPTAALTRKMPMAAPMVKQNARVDKNHATSVSGGLRVYRHSETTETTSSRLQTEQLTFTAEDLIGLAHATENQISDSPSSFIAMISDGFRDEFASKIMQEKIRGTGTGGQYLGALVSGALITVAKETGQPADTVLVENIDKMAARCWRYTSERTVYLANPTTRPQLRGLVRNVGTGGSVVNYFTNEGGDERLDGRRVFFTEFASALGDLGDLLLVNWSEYIEGLYQSLQQAESIHVRFVNHERSFKFWVRNCGQPWWSSVLTPKYGDTLSPLVTLAARA